VENKMANFNDKIKKVYNEDNDGNYGNCGEGFTKELFGNVNGAVVSAQGKIDTRKKLNTGEWANFEVKTGCGELGKVDESGNIIETIFDKNDYIVYCYRYELSVDLDASLLSFKENARVIKSEVFEGILKTLGLMDIKKSSEQYNRPAELQYKDKLAIKTLKYIDKRTGKDKREKIRTEFLNECDKHGYTIDEFVELFIK
jgi:hypothetical protein